MGMYTEFHFNVELKKDVPQNVLDVLYYMIGESEMPQHIPSHDLFNTDRWEGMLHNDSYYFPADTHSSLRYDDISRSHYLCIRTNLKNYSNEIQLFIDWIEPYCATRHDDFLGFYRYEESHLPTLICVISGVWQQIAVPYSVIRIQ